jgi:hypothetical protein
MARNARKAPWLPTIDSSAPVTHTAKLVIVAQATLFVDVTRAVIPCVVLEGTVEDITMIVAKEIDTLTIVWVMEVRAKGVQDTKNTSMEVAVKEVTSIVSDSQILATTIGATPGKHLPSDITTVINLTMQTIHRTTTSSTRAASDIVAAHHVGNKIHSQTVEGDSSAKRNMFYDLSVFHKRESIASTTVKLGDDSTAKCTQIGEFVLQLSDERRLRLSPSL